MGQPGSGEGTIERRRFLLVDAITLVAAAALMLSADRAIHWVGSSFSSWIGDDAYFPLPRYNDKQTRIMAWSLALTGLSFALLVSPLARSADRRRLRRGAPGLFVHLAVATVVLLRMTEWLTRAAIEAFFFVGRLGSSGTRWPAEIMHYLLVASWRDTAFAVAATWLTLATVGRWNPERAWDDRLGRFIGALWMIFCLGAPLFARLP